MNSCRMKEYFKTLLKQGGWYEYLKFSRVFTIYEYLFKPEVADARRREESLYKSFVGDCNLIFDIGANDGHKAVAFLSISKKVVCVEPDPSNYRLLKIRFRNKKGRISCEDVAVTAPGSKAESFLYIHYPGSAMNTINEKFKCIVEGSEKERWKERITYSQQPVPIKTVTLDDLIKKHGKPDFIKIDTEGSDIPVLLGLSQRIRHLSFEILFPEFSDELKQGLQHISGLDNAALFNLILDEELLLPDFVTENFLLEYINKHLTNSFEIVVRMST
jgi:FkbM family methyltransferase